MTLIDPTMSVVIPSTMSGCYANSPNIGANAGREMLRSSQKPFAKRVVRQRRLSAGAEQQLDATGLPSLAGAAYTGN